MSQDVRAQLQKLENDYFIDAGGVGVQELVDNAEKELSTRPEFKPLLLGQLQQEYFEPLKATGRQGATTALSILALRSDLSSDEQKIITDELKRLAASPGDKPFVNGAIHLLSHYPSPEHEELVLRFLKENGWADQTVMSAFDSLMEIGTAKSLAVMRDVHVLMKAQKADKWLVQQMGQDIDVLEYRLEKGAATARPQIVTESLSQKKLLSEAGSIVETPKIPSNSAMDGSSWVGILFAMILVIALACRTFQKKD